MFYVLAEDDNAYPDFAIFGPHGNRMLRKLTMTGLAPSGVGCFRRVEIRGPPDLYTWTRSFMVWRALAIMLVISGVNALDRYNQKVWNFARDYGMQVWHLLYQAETRMRV